MSLSNAKTILVFKDREAVADFAIKKWMEMNSKAVTGAIFALKNMGWKDVVHNIESEQDEPPQIEFFDSET